MNSSDLFITSREQGGGTKVAAIHVGLYHDLHPSPSLPDVISGKNLSLYRPPRYPWPSRCIKIYLPSRTGKYDLVENRIPLLPVYRRPSHRTGLKRNARRVLRVEEGYENCGRIERKGKGKEKEKRGWRNGVVKK